MTYKSRLILASVILGAVLTFTGIKDLLVLWKEPVDVLHVDPDTLENGMHVHTTVELVWDQFIEETSYRTVNGIKVSDEKESARYYALPYLKLEDGMIMVDQLIAIRVSSSTPACRTLETILNETNEWWFDETGKVDYGYTTLEVEGRLRRMTEEERDYMIDYITMDGTVSRSEAEKYMAPYVILVQNLNTGYTITVIGLILLVIPILFLAITRSKKKQEADMMYRRPRDIAKPEGTYYEPDDGTTTPTAYGSMTYGTNTYGQDTYGQNTYGQTTYGQTTYGSTEGGQGAYSAFGNTETAQNANPLYGDAVTGQNANPIYGDAVTGQNANPIYGNAVTGQNANPLYGNAVTGQNANPIYGDAVTGQNVNPIYGNAVTGQNANPIYGDAVTGQNANPLYGNAVTEQNANPLYGTAKEGDYSGLNPEFLKRS